MHFLALGKVRLEIPGCLLFQAKSKCMCCCLPPILAAEEFRKFRMFVMFASSFRSVVSPTQLPTRTALLLYIRAGDISLERHGTGDNSRSTSNLGIQRSPWGPGLQTAAD